MSIDIISSISNLYLTLLVCILLNLKNKQNAYTNSENEFLS